MLANSGGTEKTLRLAKIRFKTSLGGSIRILKYKKYQKGLICLLVQHKSNNEDDV